MATQASIKSAAKPVRGAGVQMVYEQLRATIVGLELPPGSPLDETRLSRQFAMSRTPVREALVRLVAEGLVNTLPNRSTVVAPIDFEKLPVYFEALTLMYRVTTRAAALRRTPAEIEVIRAEQAEYVKAVERSDAVAMISTNRDFHLAIAEGRRQRLFHRPVLAAARRGPAAAAALLLRLVRQPPALQIC